MKPNDCPLLNLRSLLKAAEFLSPFGWNHFPMNNNLWIFEKNGKLFDLSAADISRHESIFENESFCISG